VAPIFNCLDKKSNYGRSVFITNESMILKLKKHNFRLLKNMIYQIKVYSPQLRKEGSFPKCSKK
ncbi:TPA: hypothetical protein ACQOB8_001064, partial [Streptococcus pyogenes]